MVSFIAIPTSDFRPIEIFRFAKVSKIKWQSTTQHLASLLVYKPFYGNTGILILSPTFG